MKKGRRLDSRKVLKEIRVYRRQLEAVLQSGDDFKELHADIVRFLKVVCTTKSEYSEVAEYPDWPEDIMTGLAGLTPDGQTEEPDPIIELKQRLIEGRKQFTTHLCDILAELEKEYKLRVKLEPTSASSIKADIQAIRKDMKNISTELSRLTREIEDLREQHQSG